jgi:hypothetical protein
MINNRKRWILSSEFNILPMGRKGGRERSERSKNAQAILLYLEKPHRITAQIDIVCYQGLKFESTTVKKIK